MAEIGRVKNTVKSPPDIIRDCRNPVSAFRPNTRAMTMGARGMVPTRNRYPRRPNPMASQMSKGLLRREKAPIRVSTPINGAMYGLAIPTIQTSTGMSRVFMSTSITFPT